jgi:hypothetical protein
MLPVLATATSYAELLLKRELFLESCPAKVAHIRSALLPRCWLTTPVMQQEELPGQRLWF